MANLAENVTAHVLQLPTVRTLAVPCPGHAAATSSSLPAVRCGWFTEGFDTLDLKEAKAPF
jgi:hypothetical protein